jgi:hypothetical protein
MDIIRQVEDGKYQIFNPMNRKEIIADLISQEKSQLQEILKLVVFDENGRLWERREKGRRCQIKGIKRNLLKKRAHESKE